MSTKNYEEMQERVGSRGTPPARRAEREGHDQDESAHPVLAPAPKSDDERGDLLRNKPFDYIERTRPEDRLPPDVGHGQLTRDNVNPAIPSAKRGEERIVDPNTLGMEQATVAQLQLRRRRRKRQPT